MPATLLNLPHTLLLATAQATVVAAGVVVAQWILRDRLTPQLKYALWSLPFLRLLFVVSIPAPFSIHGVTASALPATWNDAFQASLAAPQHDFAPHTSGLATPASLFLALWLSGVLIFGALVIVQATRLSLAVARGKMVTDPATLELLASCRSQLGLHAWLVLLETDAVNGPVLLGAVRPKLLLPTGFLRAVSRDQLRHVLLHELAHFRRGDIWAGWLMNVLLVVYWFNPVLWWLRLRVLRDRECACDATVLKRLAGSERSAYGHTLLDLADAALPSPQWLPSMASVLETSTNLTRRIEMIAQFGKHGWIAVVLGVVVIVGLGLVGLTDARTPAADAAYATPEGGYTHLVVFEPAGSFAPERPAELLQVFNGVCNVKTGYFRTKPENGKLVGSICTDNPQELQKELATEPRLKYVSGVPLTAELFASHWATEQLPLHPPAPGTFVTPKGNFTYLVTFVPANGFAPKTPRELLQVFNGICNVGTGYFRTTPENGILVGTICTDQPDVLQQQFAREPRLKWVSVVPLTESLFNTHQAKKQESLP